MEHHRSRWARTSSYLTTGANIIEYTKIQEVFISTQAHSGCSAWPGMLVPAGQGSQLHQWIRTVQTVVCVIRPSRILVSLYSEVKAKEQTLSPQNSKL